MQMLRLCALALVGIALSLGGSLAQPSYTVCPQGPPTCPFKKISEAIQAAEPGSTITIGPGTYSERITIDKPLTLQGAGRTLTIVRASRQDFTMTVQGAARVTLEDLRFEGQREQFEGIGQAIKVMDQAQLTVRGVAFIKGKQAIILANQAVATIQNAVISNYDEGIGAGGTAQLLVAYSAFIANRMNVSLYTSAQGIIEQNEIAGGVIEIDGDAQAMIQENRLKFVPTLEGARVRLLNRSRAHIRENEFVLFRIEATGTSHLTLDRNVIQGGESIYFGESSSGVVLNNEISDLLYSGIYVSSDGVIEIRGNRILRNQTGVDIAVYGRGRIPISPNQLVKIESNVISQNAKCGISVLRGRVDGSDNEMRDNGIDLCYRAPAQLRRPLVPQSDKLLIRVPDEYKFIQEAIDAVAPGGTVEVAPGRYEGNLLLYKPAHLRGAGGKPEETIIIPTSVTYGIPMIMVLSEAGQFSFSNITLTLDKEDQDLIRVYGSAQASMRHVIVRAGSISFWDESQAQIEESTFEEGGDIFAGDQAQIFVSRSRFVQGHKPDDFIYIKDRASLHLQASILEGQGEGEAITLVDRAKALIEHSVFRKLSSPLFMRHYSEVTLRENAFLEMTYNGLALGTFDEDRGFALAERNNIEASQGPGIVVRHIQAVLRENRVTGNRGDGILLVGSATVEIIGNQITENEGWGIAVFNEECQGSPLTRWQEMDRFRGTVTGSDNILQNNKKGDLCGVPESLKKP
jgi:parallel beta-helix repeat protein